MVECAIWRTPAEDLQSPRNGAEFNSPRAGGEYFITGSAVATITNTNRSVRARLTTWLINQRRQGVSSPTISTAEIEAAKISRDISIASRADRLLELLASRTKRIGEQLRLTNDSDLILESLAWTESTDAGEVKYLLRMLGENGWVDHNFSSAGADALILPSGYSHLDSVRIQFTASTQGFVAMWFDSSMGSTFAQGFLPAIKDAGYSAFRIDQKAHNNKIDDEIVAEIRRSRFLIADFTQGSDGARGGVYFEAGFAKGLGIPVIFTVRADMISSVHFDTRQYAHLLWTDHADLRKKLADHISATIGDGPLRDA